MALRRAQTSGTPTILAVATLAVAAALNLAVLTIGDDTPAVSAAPTTPATAPEPPSAVDIVVDVTIPLSGVAAPSDADEAAGATEFLGFAFSGVADSIVIANHSGERIELWMVEPATGWRHQATRSTDSEVELVFSSAEQGEAVFTASLTDGDVTVARQS